jgi:hypothetical protein
MQHPFEGILQPDTPLNEAKPTRRALLVKLVGAAAALLGVGTAASAQGWRRRPTTLALGEEGGSVTTYATGEEGGWATTYAWGEEGSWWPEPRRWATTYATGEEGGWSYPPLPPLPTPPPIPPIRRPTTLAIGEEGGRY